MSALPSARVLAALSTLLWAGAGVTLVFVGIDRWRPPTGGLPHGSWLVLWVLAATSVAAASWVASARQPYASIGFSIALGAWLLPIAAGWSATPGWGKSVLLALPPLLVGALTEIGTGLSIPRSSPSRLRLVAWLASGAAALVLAFAYDPFTDPSCRRTCLSLNVLFGERIASTTTAMSLAGVLVAVATLAGFGAVLSSTPTWPVRASLLSLVVVGGGLALIHLAPANGSSGRRALENVTGLALILPSTAVLAHAALVRWRRRGVERLAAQLNDGSALTGVEFAVGTPPRWVDAAGRPSRLPPGGSATELSDHRGPVVRWIGGGSANRTPPEVTQGLHPATWLALDNARLAASARAQLLDLRASQQRIVATADAERLRIGRDLHDRTQQRLVGASLHLRLAAGRADPDTAGPLLDAERRLRPVLTALRAISHGPFPEVLAEEGLAAALSEWAADADLSDLTCPELGRLPDDVERAAYASVVAVADAPDAQVAVARRGGDLVVEVTGGAPRAYGPGGPDLAGVSPAADLTATADRVGAAGGTLREIVDPVGRRTVEVVLPCGS